MTAFDISLPISAGFVAAMLNVMQRLQPELQVLFAFFIPLRNAGIKVPAVVVERLAVEAIGDQRRNLALPFFLQVQKSHHHVRHLDAGVVDIVLHIHARARGLKQADKRIAQNGIAQMADMSSFVGIDAGVLDQNLFAAGRTGLRRLANLAAAGQLLRG